MTRARNVKIVATLGPASNDYEMIRALFDAGADVFRLNMSHGEHSEIRVRHEIIRQIEKDTGKPIAILADLQGPKLRCGVFANDGGEDLAVGAKFRFDMSDVPGDAARVQLPHKEIFQALEVGSTLLINDGKMRVCVEARGDDFADCVVEVGGAISNRKGVNVPDVVLPLAALSEKDLRDLEFVCELGVDWLALSTQHRAGVDGLAPAFFHDLTALCNNAVPAPLLPQSLHVASLSMCRTKVCGSLFTCLFLLFSFQPGFLPHAHVDFS